MVLKYIQKQYGFFLINVAQILLNYIYKGKGREKHNAENIVE